MKNVSDIIEEFIMQQFLLDDEINLSRNELADFFGCAPSQINYVLSTRFTPMRGFDVESRRGGGGFIKVYKVVSSASDTDTYLHNLILNVVGNEIDFANALHLLENLLNKAIIDSKQFSVIKNSISKKALSNPIKIENYLRANILKSILTGILKEGL